MFYNVFELSTSIVDNRLYAFNKNLNPYIELTLRLIEERIDNNNLYGTSGVIRFNKYTYNIREPFFSKISYDNILSNPSFLLNKIFGSTNYLLTGLKRKIEFNGNIEIKDTNQIVVKYYEKNNKKYLATYSTDDYYSLVCCCVCNGTTQYAEGSGTSIDDADYDCSQRLNGTGICSTNNGCTSGYNTADTFSNLDTTLCPPPSPSSS